MLAYQPASGKLPFFPLFLSVAVAAAAAAAVDVAFAAVIIVLVRWYYMKREFYARGETVVERLYVGGGCQANRM